MLSKYRHENFWGIVKEESEANSTSEISATNAQNIIDGR
jgi:hypothetical protein